jgi:pimeloyl-ACP methyl ester carboxylesterase
VISLLIVAGLVMTARKLRNYLFDVLAWTMESEKDERFEARQKVVQLGQDLIRHVTSDPKCVSTIIVGHSLGTAIATEALLKEGQRASLSENARALRDISKVRTVFTVGSPIDRIFFFFQADTTFSHRYHRLLEEQRISLGLPPFRFKSVTGRARLYNFWSRFDPISSPVYSVRKAVSERRDALFNIEVLPRRFSLPQSAHTSYFADPRLMRMIYHSVMENAVPPDKDSVPVKDIIGKGGSLIASALIVAILLSGTVLMIWGKPILVTSALGIFSVLILAWAAAKRKRYEAQIGKFLGRSS